MKKKGYWDCIGVTTMQLAASTHGSTVADNTGKLPTAESSTQAAKKELVSASDKSQRLSDSFPKEEDLLRCYKLSIVKLKYLGAG